MTINNRGVRTLVVYSTGTFVVGMTILIVWALGMLALWLLPSMASEITGDADADPRSFLVRLLAGMLLVIVAMIAPRIAKTLWFFLGEIGESALRKISPTDRA